MKVPFFCLCLLFISSITWAQLPAEGILTYQVDTVRRLEKYPGNMRLTNLIISYKDSGKLSKIYAGYPDNFAGNGAQVVLFRDKAAFLAFQVPGDSLLIIQMPDQALSASAFELVRTSETKLIESFKCRKWLIKDKLLSQTFDAWILEQEEIQIPLYRYFTTFRGIKGLPLEFDLEMSGWLLHAKLQKVGRKLIDSSAFEVPTGKTMTFDDVMREIKEFN